MSFGPLRALRLRASCVNITINSDDPDQTEGDAAMPRQRDTSYHTYADYLTWSATYGDEVVDGTAYVREPPSPTRSHQEIVGELHRQMANALLGKSCRVYVAPFDVRLPKSTESDDLVDTVVQPDLFIVCDLNKVDARGVRGAPDWLAEVLSPTTARHDRFVKLPVYERAGVREVWLIHPTDRALTTYQLEAGRYGPPTIIELKGKTQLTAVAGVTIDWDAVLAAMT
jgi:Uma2 family endonuclease